MCTAPQPTIWIVCPLPVELGAESGTRQQQKPFNPYTGVPQPVHGLVGGSDQILPKGGEGDFSQNTPKAVPQWLSFAEALSHKTD